jgi:hypothetical protein
MAPLTVKLQEPRAVRGFFLAAAGAGHKRTGIARFNRHREIQSFGNRGNGRNGSPRSISSRSTRRSFASPIACDRAFNSLSMTTMAVSWPVTQQIHRDNAKDMRATAVEIHMRRGAAI